MARSCSKVCHAPRKSGKSVPNQPFHLVGTWNKLPEGVVEAGILMAFNKYLDRWIGRKSLQECGPNVGK